VEERTVLWAHNKESKRDYEAKEREKQETEECTFEPDIKRLKLKEEAVDLPEGSQK
jgi:hypothetical protein